MWTYVLGPLLVLLPHRWRRHLLGGAPVNWTQAALYGGFIHGVAGLLAMIGWYFYYIKVAIGRQTAAALEAMGQKDTPAGLTDVGLSYSMGLSAMTDFVLHPVTWVLGYFAVEGVVRFAGAYANQESYPTLPLVLADKLISTGRQRAFESRTPIVADEVTRGTSSDPWDLRVASCRPKPDWKYPLTIRWGEEFFEVQGSSSEEGTGARPYIYLLRRPPAGKAYHGVDEFDPEAIVREARAREAEPSFLVVGIRNEYEKYRIKMLPIVADYVFRGDGREGWHLRVESCRPKPQWMRGRTIRYEGVLYRVEGECPGATQRPFGYRLMFVPPNEAARGVLDYAPDEPLRLYGKRV